MKTTTNLQISTRNAKIIIVWFMAVMLACAHVSCGTQKGGCYGTRGMSGYK